MPIGRSCRPVQFVSCAVYNLRAGWDNATVFDEGSPIESPDLSAYLSVQMEVLANVAARLGRPVEARQWKQQSNQLLECMLQRFWQDVHVKEGRAGLPSGR